MRLVAGFIRPNPAGVQKVTSVEGITEYSFPTDCACCSFPITPSPKSPSTSLTWWARAIEGYGETGMAHLMEHILFLRTKADKDIKKELTDHGALWNGTTW